jgi:hypothetical protein
MVAHEQYFVQQVGSSAGYGASFIDSRICGGVSGPPWNMFMRKFAGPAAGGEFRLLVRTDGCWYGGGCRGAEGEGFNCESRLVP